MASGAGPLPLCDILSDVRAIDALVTIANLSGFLLPDFSVPRSLAR
jgi:hypothetical protein